MASAPHDPAPPTSAASPDRAQPPVLSGELTPRAWVVAVAAAIIHASALAWAMAALS